MADRLPPALHVAPLPSLPGPTGGGGERLHLAHVDGLRALAALYVLCVHVLPGAWGQQAPHSTVLRWLAKVTSEGHFAVTMFIVISGFCLMLPAARAGRRLRGGMGVFFLRRFWRIAPPMYAAVLLSVLILQFPALRASRAYTQVTGGQLVAHALLVETFVPRGLLPNNGPLWSISVECLMYLFFPLLVLLARQFGTVLTTTAYVAAGYAMAFATRSTPFGAATWQYLGAFALGALAAELSYGPTATAEVPAVGRRRFPWYTVAALCLAIVAGATGAFGWKWVDRHVVAFDLPIAIATMAVLIGASRPGPNAVRRVLQWRPLAAVGLFSYSLYIIHYPVADALSFGLLTRITNEFVREAVLLGVVVPVVVAAAYGFYRLVERPSHHFARQFGRRPKPTTGRLITASPAEAVGASAE